MLDAGKILVNTRIRRMKVALVAAFMLALALPAFAHDIPNDVTVNAFVKPEGQRLRLLVRVPLKAMREVDVPRRSGGFLDLDSPQALIGRHMGTLEVEEEVRPGAIRRRPPNLENVYLKLTGTPLHVEAEAA
jgi:hypothetical protein